MEAACRCCGAGFRPTGSYTVSFVFMHSGAPFAKKGGADLSLPSMDIPISLLSWEVFLPEQYKVKDFGGDVIAANRVPEPFREEDAINAEESRLGRLQQRKNGSPSRTDGRLCHGSQRRRGSQRACHDHSRQWREPNRDDRRPGPLG